MTMMRTCADGVQAVSALAHGLAASTWPAASVVRTRPMALDAAARYNRSVPARPLVFALGLLLCLAGSIVCATAAPGDPQEFPSLSDILVIVGGVLAIVGVAGREARGRQLLGRRPAAPSTPEGDGER